MEISSEREDVMKKWIFVVEEIEEEWWLMSKATVYCMMAPDQFTDLLYWTMVKYNKFIVNITIS